MSSEHTTPDTTEYAIEVNGLSKCYQIYDKPSDRLKQMLMRGRKQYYKEFWALKDVSFKIKKGETVGIIGRNGSGKSTLLQMICGTLNPTGGEVKVNGRVAALLELGAGFNPEFSGVENVYMAASLYGLSKEEVDQRFDAIATFADIGDHIHQPVKTYSSGMYVRLAFAVIAHVDADILVIDEALAVGDAVFTQKCMRFIRKFRENGTLLFVSHDINSVINLCNRAMWINRGVVEYLGASKLASEIYLKYTLSENYTKDIEVSDIVVESPKGAGEIANKNVVACVDENELNNVIDYKAAINWIDNIDYSTGWKTGDGEIISLEIVSNDRKSELIYKGGEIVDLEIKAIAHKKIEMPIIGFMVKDRLGQDLFGENTIPITKNTPIVLSAEEIIVANFKFQLPMLQNGKYSITCSFAEGTQEEHVQHHWLHDAIFIDVNSSLVRWGIVGVKFQNVTVKKYEENEK